MSVPEPESWSHLPQSAASKVSHFNRWTNSTISSWWQYCLFDSAASLILVIWAFNDLFYLFFFWVQWQYGIYSYRVFFAQHSVFCTFLLHCLCFDFFAHCTFFFPEYRLPRLFLLYTHHSKVQWKEECDLSLWSEQCGLMTVTACHQL